MNEALLLMGTVILICILMQRFLDRIPVPSLLVFLALGMCFGENGILRIAFNDYAAVNLTCSVSLIFIMFYGGFGTNLRVARPVLGQAVVLSTLGVAGTAAAVAAFAHWGLGLPVLESLLIGSVISSTDAASVFNILRANKLALRQHTDSLLEVESGSNDPMSYMLTTVTLALMSGQTVSVPLLLFQQISLGAVCGILIGAAAVRLLHRGFVNSQQGRTVFLFAVMLLAYALPAVWGGNGYLAVYLCGIWLGNANLSQKRYLVHFFDVLTDVSQVVIFFLLGLLVTPVELPAVLLPALLVMGFLTLVARPAVTAILLLPFRAGKGQTGMVAWAGLRGAASIVFAIGAVLNGVQTHYNLYNLVFCVVLFSISVQGTLLPKVAQKLSMIDRGENVEKTFNDYQEEGEINFVRVRLTPGHSWCGKTLRELALPGELLVACILREGHALVPDGNTALRAQDLLVLAARGFEEDATLILQERVVERGDPWEGKPLATGETPAAQRVVLIRRGETMMIPAGKTSVQAGDVLVLAEARNISQT